MYYQRIDVKRAVCGYAESGKGHGVRECAFFNRKNGAFHRYLETPEGKSPVDLTAKGFSEALRMGADAFYCSYWVYDSRDFSTPIGRDLVWIVRAEKGDLKFAKRITKMVVEALSSAGVDPLVKYSGDMGFDIVIPLEDIPFEVWLGDLRALDELQGELSETIVGYIRSRPGVTVEGGNSTFRIKEDEKTSLLSELRVKRGLLLAPMSINPETGLVSVPVDPIELDSFTIFDASPSRVKTREWATGRAPNYGLMRYAKAWQPQAVSGKSTG
ncbi:MAG: hypothetical protein QW567_00955 [Candidatus Hadarchaeales archaeon]